MEFFFIYLILDYQFAFAKSDAKDYKLINTYDYGELIFNIPLKWIE